MKDTPINFEFVRRHIRDSKLTNIGRASIREIKRLISGIEKETGEKFIRMEMGVPGLVPPRIGIDAEIEALESGVAAVYPDIEGLPVLKKEISRFVKLFLNQNVSETCCIPTVGSMQGGFAAFLTLARIKKERDTTLLIDPGFPVHHQQHIVLGQKF
ncbi:MAG: hypothetical protein ACM3N9_01820, partial [Syntrophothermus sp.]